MFILITICVLSFLGLALLLTGQVYFTRNLKPEYESRRPFFEDFEERLAPFFCSLIKKTGSFLGDRKEFGFFKKHFCRVSDYMNGRHCVERNGCKGYWDEVNGSKKNGDKPR